jgi:hypothetical protein
MSYPQLSTVYATDENILIRAAGDFTVLCPEWQKLASGTDGVTASASPWILTSASVDFEAGGVRPGHVVLLRRPSTVFRGSGEPFAVDAVSGGTLTLRRPGRASGAGQPVPSAEGVDFLVASLDPQIEEASFELNRRFSIDPAVPCRAPEAVYDLRDLRTACVLSVLAQRYASETRGRDGDFALKLSLVKQELSEVLARLQVRWGPGGDAQPPSTHFSTRIVR